MIGEREMRFQEAVEKLVSDPRAEAMGRETWAMHSIVCNSKRLYYVSSTIEYHPTLDDIFAGDWYVKYKDNKSTTQLQVEAAFKLAAESFNGCSYESFVGGPGDYSPPDCKCDKCIAAGRSFKYTSGTYKIDASMFEYLWNLLLPLGDTKHRKFGLEYHEHAKCRIMLQPRLNILCVEANKSEIKIGDYTCNIIAKTFSK